MTLTRNPSCTKRVAKLIQYDPVASITTRTWEGSVPVAWSLCTSRLNPSGVWSIVKDGLALAPGRCVEISAVVAAISIPTNSSYIPAASPVVMTPSTRSTLYPLTHLAVSLLAVVREAQLVMRGQDHLIRSSLLTTWSRGGHSSLRDQSRRCHMVLTTTQEFISLYRPS